MNEKYMTCEGMATDANVDVRGSYAAPPGPDWGWRTIIDRNNRDLFRLVMYNITPEGEEQIAVETLYGRP
jgi:hypothetical protein